MDKVKEYEESLRVLVVGEYLAGGTTYRRLSRKYGVARTTVHKWVASGIGKENPGMDEAQARESDESAQVRRLKAELEKARIENKLLSAMIEIAEEQLGVAIRKKRGAKR
jgi:transposase-like protein